MNAVTTGTVKVGRWEYPAEMTETGLRRNAKRDGSGEWIEGVADAKVVASFVPAEQFTDEVAEAIDALSPVQREAMAAVGNGHFDFFDEGVVEHSGIWFTHMSEQTPNPRPFRTAMQKLTTGANPLWAIGEPDYDAHGRDRWFALTALGAKVAQRLAAPVAWEALGAAKAGHTTGGGNQTKKPGKSTWKIGDPCPQGHTLTAETLYVMPSGRKQCKTCRAEMPSRKH